MENTKSVFAPESIIDSTGADPEVLKLPRSLIEDACLVTTMAW